MKVVERINVNMLHTTFKLCERYVHKNFQRLFFNPFCIIFLTKCKKNQNELAFITVLLLLRIVRPY